MGILINTLEPYNDAEFYSFCRKNPDYRIERTHKGEIIIMDLTNSETGNYNAEINAEVVFWNRESQMGKAFDSSTGFTLPNKAIKAPDVAWIKLERWLALPPEERKKFAHISPDFVIELRSSADDSLSNLKDKMEEYIENGVQLGWLLDRIEGRAYVYRPNRDVQIFDNFEKDILTGEDVMPGFEMKLSILL